MVTALVQGNNSNGGYGFAKNDTVTPFGVHSYLGVIAACLLGVQVGK
jgi:hypothetical protein